MAKTKTLTEKDRKTVTTGRRSARTPAQDKKRGKSQAAFLTAFRESCTVTQAAKTAGVGRRTHYDWLTGISDLPAPDGPFIHPKAA